MSRNKLVTIELLGKALDRVIETVVLAKAHLKISRDLGRTLHEDPAILHVAPAFWGLSLNAHLDAAQLYAAKLFDKRPGTISIEHLLETVEQLKDQFPHGTPEQMEEVVQRARAQIADLRTQHLSKIAAKRNRVLAHMDQKIVADPEKFAKDVQVAVPDLIAVFGTAESVLNELTERLRDASQWFDLLGTDDYRSVVKLVADAKCAQIRDYESRHGRWPDDHVRPKKCPKS